MNSNPEIFSELNRKRILEEADAIRLEKEATKSESLLVKSLLSLGAWMVAQGEKIRNRQSANGVQHYRSRKLVNKVY